ncbi:unnamed protein product, partial [Effrenium voratum]
ENESIPGVAWEDVFVLDQKIPRADLPIGTHEWEMSVGVYTDCAKPSGTPALSLGSAPMSAAPTPTTEVPEISQPPPQEERVSEQPPEKKQRLLARGSSEEQSSDIETIAEACLDCFKKGNLVADDPNTVTAEFWVRAFIQHAQNALADEENQEALCEALGPFPRFIARSLLEHKAAYAILSKFTAPLESLEKKFPKLFPRHGVLQALYILANASPDSTKELPLDFLPLEGKRRLVQSSLWAGFEEARFEAQVLAVTASTDDNSVRLREVQRLLQVQGEDP